MRPNQKDPLIERIENWIAYANPIDWDRFKDLFADEKRFPREYVFRGQRNSSWNLESAFARACKLHRKDFTIPNWKKHLDSFRSAARGRLSQLSDVQLVDEEMWALGQHHGLATPFLDWTESPFVAAFFAFYGTGDTQDSTRAIYALNAELVDFVYAHTTWQQFLKFAESTGGHNELEKHNDSFFSASDPFIRNFQIIERIANGEIPASLQIRNQCCLSLEVAVARSVRIVRPRIGENSRLISQRGLFSYHLGSATLESRIDELYAERKAALENFRKPHGALLIKIPIKNEDRERALRNMDHMNINHLSLFPDLAGASEYCNYRMAELPEDLTNSLR